ncbi:MAG TPA: isochorismatase family protein [Mycobacteriales bacterium]
MSQALLMMDVQNGIVDRFDAPEAYLDRVVVAQERAERAGLLVVLVRVAFTPGHPEVSARNKSLSALSANPGMTLGEPAVEPHERLLRGNGEVVVTKKRVSAFAGSDWSWCCAPTT